MKPKVWVSRSQADAYQESVRFLRPYSKRDYTALFLQQDNNDLRASAMAHMAQMIPPLEFAGSMRLGEILAGDRSAVHFCGCSFNDGMRDASEGLSVLMGRIYEAGPRTFELPRLFRYPCHHKVKDYGRGVRYADTARPALPYGPPWGPGANMEDPWPMVYPEPSKPCSCCMIVWNCSTMDDYHYVWPMVYDWLETLAYPEAA